MTAETAPAPILHRPDSLAEAIGLLEADAGALPIAGGQTLVSMLNLGFVQPTALVSLAAIPALRGVERQDDGSVRIGAMTSHAALAACNLFAGGQRLLSSAAAQIADPAIRNFGTIGGACAHGDTVADWPAALVAADALILVAGPGGDRRLPAGEFFLNIMTTDLGPGELITAILVPPLDGNGLYLKYARVEGDYATVSVAVVAATREAICTRIAIAVGACGPRPLRLKAAEDLLLGRAITPALAGEAGAILAGAARPNDDVRGSAAYRKRILPQLVARAVIRAAA